MTMGAGLPQGFWVPNQERNDVPVFSGAEWVPKSPAQYAALLNALSDPFTAYLRADGTRNLTGNMAVSAGVTIDGVDIGAHTHTGAGSNGPQVDHANLSNVTANQHHNQAHGASDHNDRTRYLYLSAENAFARDGVPALAIQGTNTLYAAWGLDSATTESVFWQVAPLADDTAGAVSVDLHWTNLGAGAGNVVLRAFINPTANAGDYNSTAGLVLGTSTTIAAPAQNVRKVSNLAISYTHVGGTSYTVGIQRLGGDGNDTLGNDMGLVAITLSYTADS